MLYRFLSVRMVLVGRYNRTIPKGPWIYKGGRFWDYDYQEADDVPVFDTPFGKVGILICSEVYSPELSRLLALKGAEIIFLPAGVCKYELHETWRNLIWSRAIENLAYHGDMPEHLWRRARPCHDLQPRRNPPRISQAWYFYRRVRSRTDSLA